MNTRIWNSKKQALLVELHALERRSDVLRVLETRDGGGELRMLVRFDTATLVRPPDGVVRCQGPIVVGLRYHERFLSVAPVPWEIVSVLAPPFVFHPNIDPAGALCLGHPPPAVRLEEIMHMTWAALVLNLRLVDTVEWHGLNPEAATYVRDNQHSFPLDKRGLCEARRGERKEEFA
jgi:hypothetical protein